MSSKFPMKGNLTLLPQPIVVEAPISKARLVIKSYKQLARYQAAVEQFKKLTKKEEEPK